MPPQYCIRWYHSCMVGMARKPEAGGRGTHLRDQGGPTPASGLGGSGPTPADGLGGSGLTPASGLGGRKEALISSVPRHVGPLARTAAYTQSRRRRWNLAVGCSFAEASKWVGGDWWTCTGVLVTGCPVATREVWNQEMTVAAVPEVPTRAL